MSALTDMRMMPREEAPSCFTTFTAESEAILFRLRSAIHESIRLSIYGFSNRYPAGERRSPPSQLLFAIQSNQSLTGACRHLSSRMPSLCVASQRRDQCVLSPLHCHCVCNRTAADGFQLKGCHAIFVFQL